MDSLVAIYELRAQEEASGPTEVVALTGATFKTLQVCLSFVVLAFYFYFDQ